MSWAVTEEAVRAIRALAADLCKTKTFLEQQVSALNGCFQEQADGLGPHARYIRELLEEAEAAAQDASLPVRKLALKLERAAVIRESLLAKDPYGGGAKGGGYVKIDGVRHRTDDNGTPYARRDSESGQYGLLPNNSYQLSGYTYETNSGGSVSRVTGKLRLKGEGKRKALNDTVPGMLPGDERGHLIGDQFAGSNRIGNLVAMGFDVNRSEYRSLEESWARDLEAGKRVEVDIQPLYEEGAQRPAVFVVSWETDGAPDIALFENYDE